MTAKWMALAFLWAAPAGRVMIRGLSPNATIATTGSPTSFDATRFRTLEMVAQGSSLIVYLDGARLTFTQNNASVTTTALSGTTGSNDGAVGIAFGDEANAGKAGGQRAQNLIVAQPGGTRDWPRRQSEDGPRGRTYDEHDSENRIWCWNLLTVGRCGVGRYANRIRHFLAS